MAETVPQTFANHTKLDPLFHFFILPVLAFTLIAAIVNAIRHPDLQSAGAVVFVFAVIAIAFKARLYALKVQDRVIRLEERLRLATLIAEPFRSRIVELTEGQLVGLRFASDAELPELVERVLNQKLGKREIKTAVQSWRPDHFRV